MIDKKMQDAINDQINFELYSSYIYLSMAAYAADKGLSGMENWFKLQAQEEVEHAMKFYTYIHERGGRVILSAIKAPRVEWDSIFAAFKNAYEHECVVSKRINNLVDISIELRDHASNAFLQWYVAEQVEEESNVSDIVSKLKMIGDHAAALLMLDRDLASRKIGTSAE